MAKSLADYIKKEAPAKDEKKAGDFSEMNLLRLAEKVFEPSYNSEQTRTEQLMERVKSLKLLIAACSK